MATKSSVADTNRLTPITTISTTTGYIAIFKCKQCGSLVDLELEKSHRDMHKFMVEVVHAFENHKITLMVLIVITLLV